METSSQLHHDLILPSDEASDESLGEMEGLLSSRHKQLLLKCLAKRERPSEAETLQSGLEVGERSSGILARLQSERFIESNNLRKLSHGGEVQIL